VLLRKQRTEKQIHIFIPQSHLRDSDKLGPGHESSFTESNSTETLQTRLWFGNLCLKNLLTDQYE